VAGCTCMVGVCRCLLCNVRLGCSSSNSSSITKRMWTCVCQCAQCAAEGNVCRFWATACDKLLRAQLRATVSRVGMTWREP
jgi:hypothetical protein